MQYDFFYISFSKKMSSSASDNGPVPACSVHSGIHPPGTGTFPGSGRPLPGSGQRMPGQGPAVFQ